MIIQAWAEEFSGADAIGAGTREDINRHVADTAVAFFAGCASPEARALARFYCGEASAASSCANLAAAAAAMVRRTECDDIHVASCITPGSIVVPVALAMAARAGISTERFNRAVAAGYVVGLRLGSALGGASALGSGIWPTYFAAPVMAAATASVCLGHDANRIASALGIAAAGAGGRVGRPSGHPSGRWLAIGEAVGKGCRAALAAADGFRGDPGLISADWLAAIAGSKHIRPEALKSREGIEAVGFKPFVAARQTANAIVAFQTILQRGIAPQTIQHIEIGVPPINAAMVARAASAHDRLSTIANMHMQIAAAALHPDLLYDLERVGQPAADLSAFGNRITIIPDATLEVYLPHAWAARVRVFAEGQQFEETCATIAGDPGCGDVEIVIRGKLVRMVPSAYQDLCAQLLSDVDDNLRQSQRAVLWQGMLEAMRECA
ncbi:MmgE/PrpD family protein [Microvirga alba]|uniref:MmgE/PrpD family protein n=1 Tax=Microvirga alba TaxID=2791025 RepID=A0A931BT82_9HYPH|nr:MmgE/PrpD family protein [Microvirga alba]MBF9235284.1 MmgE/PrpD family protein [Microvirga alba]